MLHARYHAQLPERILQPLGERLERFGEADRPGLPVRVAEHEVVDQMIEGLALDRDLKVVHPREIGFRSLARRVHLSRSTPPSVALPLPASA